MDDFIGKIGGCILKLVIIQVVIGAILCFLGEPSTVLGWLGIGKWGEAYYDSVGTDSRGNQRGKAGLSESEKKEFDKEIKDFFERTTSAVGLKIKNLLNKFLDLDKRFDEIKYKIDNINTRNLNKQDINIQNEVYNTLVENNNQLVEINTQIQNIDIELFNIKKEVIKEYCETNKYDDYSYYDSHNKDEITDLIKNDGGTYYKEGKECHYIPEAIIEDIKNLETNLKALMQDVEKKMQDVEKKKEESGVIGEGDSQCWYILGTKGELEERNIARAKSLLIWSWGAELNDEGLFDKRYFFQGDKRKITKIPISESVKKYEILSDMPEDSYQKKHDYIEIKDKKKFWSNTDFLVILLDKKETE